MGTSQQRIFGLVGFPLTHSFSAEFFNSMFKRDNINARYINFEIEDIGDLMKIPSEFPTLEGFNVTIPYKELVMPYIDRLDDIAKSIGAVNTVRVTWREGDPCFNGFNTDAPAFAQSLKPIAGPRDNALVLGSGGASKAVQWALKSLGIQYTVVSRSPKEGQMGYEGLDAHTIHSHLIVINTTPLGTYPDIDQCPPIPYRFLTPEHLCYDLVYNPETTLFMKKASEHGCEVKNGKEMLVLQALDSWRIWNMKI